jgi:uncharacterized protein YjbJ (UPF0337 family)
MPDNTDDLKGRAKEAAGAITGDDDLKHEGKADQAVGKVKGVIEDVVDKVEEGIDKVKDKL